MIPKKLDNFLKENLPETTLKTRLIKEDGRCYLEFSNLDVHLL
jgi:hypothetical protein